MVKVKDKEKILKATREKKVISYKRTPHNENAILGILLKVFFSFFFSIPSG